MSDPKTIQQALFAQIKNKLPGHLSVAEEVATLLRVSNDSAYRRIRGEKMLTLDELAILCNTYPVSIDELLHLQNNSIIFNGQQTDFTQFELEQHLTFILQQLQHLNSFTDASMYYLAKDVPVFHYFHFPQLAAFKFYAWLKTILHNTTYNNRKFILAEAVNERWQQLSQQIIQTYTHIPCHEIWSVETINSTLRQIEYCREALLFEDETTIQLLYSQLLQLINHIEEQAANGQKFMPDSQTVSTGAAFQLYYNGALLGDNSILMQLNSSRKVFINHAILNYINTSNDQFCNYTFDAIQTIIKKSTLVSVVGEKDRSKFFNVLRNKVQKHITT